MEIIYAGLEKALDYLGVCLIVAMAYFWSWLILSTRIQGKALDHNRTDKTISYLMATGVAAISATIFGYIEKSVSSGIAAFVVIWLASIVATLRLYKTEKSKA